MRTATAVTVVLLGMLAYAQATQYAFKANFVHRESKFGEGYASGVMYARYDTANTKNNVIRYDYTVPTSVSVIHVQKDKRIYKRCNNECEGSGVESMNLPPLMYDSNIFKSCSQVSAGYQCSGTGLKSIVFKTKTAGAAPVSFTLSNGKEFTLSNQASYTFSDSIFNVPDSWDCGHCVTMIDLFFLLDISGSIDCSEWTTMINFVKRVMDKFTISATSTAASIILWSTRVSVPWPLWNTKYIKNMDPSSGVLACPTGGGTEQWLGSAR